MCLNFKRSCISTILGVMFTYVWPPMWIVSRAYQHKTTSDCRYCLDDIHANSWPWDVAGTRILMSFKCMSSVYVYVFYCNTVGWLLYTNILEQKSLIWHVFGRWTCNTDISFLQLFFTVNYIFPSIFIFYFVMLLFLLLCFGLRWGLYLFLFIYLFSFLLIGRKDWYISNTKCYY